jgi:hypothetical protein
MAIAHAGGLAGHGELDGAAKAAALVDLRVAHEGTGCFQSFACDPEHVPGRRSRQAAQAAPRACPLRPKSQVRFGTTRCTAALFPIRKRGMPGE